MLFRLAPRARVFALALAALVTTLGLFLAPNAFAQATAGGASITVVNEQSLPRLDAKGNTIQKRAITLNPEGVSLQDCIDDQSIQFNLVISGFEANASIQQWASTGADCTAQTSRSGGVQQCWQTGPNIPLATNATVPIKVRDLMKGAPPASATATNNSADICGQVDLTTISVFFLYFSPGNVSNAASSHTTTITVDTVGPAPPGGLSTLPGNTRITVNWTAISGGGGTDDSGTTSSNTATGGGLTSLTGVEVYCVPAETVTTAPATPVCTTTPNTPTTPTTPVTDAGDAGDAEAGVDAAAATVIDAGSSTTCTDGGGGGTTNCSSSIFTGSDGGSTLVTADFTAKYGCGNITGNTGTSVVAQNVGGQPLVNGTRYAVAVAATDAFGNVGPLSPTVCEVPAETTDFWDGYKAAGGKAGGGCATSGDEELPVGSLGIFGVVAALGASSVRRRWRKNR